MCSGSCSLNQASPKMECTVSDVQVSTIGLIDCCLTRENVCDPLVADFGVFLVAHLVGAMVSFHLRLLQSLLYLRCILLELLLYGLQTLNLSCSSCLSFATSFSFSGVGVSAAGAGPAVGVRFLATPPPRALHDKELFIIEG